MEKAIGFIGLGRMGKNCVLHLLEEGIHVVGNNRTQEVSEQFFTEYEQENSSNAFPAKLHIASSYKEIIDMLPIPRTILIMVKSGPAVDEVLEGLIAQGLGTQDTVIDCGNSFYEDTKRRFTSLSDKGIHYIDCGTSGGVEGARFGACLMLGGDKQKVSEYSWLWESLSRKSVGAPPDFQGGDWTYFGPSGAGHYVKMVHNGVEYGIDQAIGEGFALLSTSEYTLDIEKVAHNWARGSVVRGWLIDLLSRALAKDPQLASYSGVVGGGETGTWTLSVAKKQGIVQPILEEAVKARQKSQTHPTFATKVVSALRFEYGGHKEESSK